MYLSQGQINDILKNYINYLHLGMSSYLFQNFSASFKKENFHVQIFCFGRCTMRKWRSDVTSN